MTTEFGLSTGDINWLAQVGQQVSDAPEEHRDIAIGAAVDTASRYRDRAEWGEIATALGTTANELREWRSQHRSKSKPDRVLLAPRHRPPERSASSALVVITGHPNARPDQTNDFTTETAMIRDRCDLRFTVKEIAGIALHQIAHVLDEHDPVLLHVAAHSEYGDVFLTRSGAPVGTTHSMLADAISRARHRPTVVVLNFCDSIAIDQRLADAGHLTVAWTGAVDDRQCREFNEVFYRQLTAGHPLGTCFDDAEITMARWPELLKPRLLGDRSVRL